MKQIWESYSCLYYFAHDEALRRRRGKNLDMNLQIANLSGRAILLFQPPSINGFFPE